MKQNRLYSPRSFLNVAFVVTTSLLVVTSLALAAPQQGQRGYGPPGSRGSGGGGQGPGYGPMAGVFHELDLTPEQLEQVRNTIHTAMDGELGDLMTQEREARRELRRMMHDPEAEENAIIDAVRSASSNAEQVAVQRHRLTVALFEILDEEQRAKAKELIAELPDNFGGQRGPRGWRRGAPPSGEKPGS